MVVRLPARMCRPGVRRAFTALVSAALIGILQDAAMHTEAQSSTYDPRRIETLFSEDDVLCRPLGRLYDKLNHEHPQDFDWADRYVGQFGAIGLRQPKALDDALHPFLEEPHSAYYRLSLTRGQQPRLVYLEDFWFGRSNYRTNLWIFKQSEDVGEKFFDITNSDGLGAGFKPEEIDLAILFNRPPLSPTGYPHVSLPYYFRKIATRNEMAEIDQGKEEYLPMPAITAGSAYIVQRPFLFGKRTVILVQSAGEYLVYQLRDSQMDDVCYFASSSELKSIHHSVIDMKGEEE